MFKAYFGMGEDKLMYGGCALDGRPEQESGPDG
jgi:hypothetical protein